jgi:hypothetical protein
MNATSNPQAAAEQALKNYRDSTAQLGLNTSIPESVRATAEKIVDKSREAYDRSKEALDASVTTLERTFDRGPSTLPAKAPWRSTASSSISPNGT